MRAVSDHRILMLLTFIFCLTSIATGQDELLTQAPDEYRSYGTVVDDLGQPISNAKASLVKLPWERGSKISLLSTSPTVESESCTQDGEFDLRISGTDPRWNAANLAHHLLVIEADGFETSITRVTRERLLVDLPFSITTKVCKPWTLKVLDKNGASITDAKLQVGQIDNHRLPFKFKLENQKDQANRGVFEINTVAQDSLKGVYVSLKTGGNFYLPVQSNESGPFVQLPETGIVKGVFKLPESVSPAKLVGKEVIITGGTLKNLSWVVLPLDENASATASRVSLGPVKFDLLGQESISLCQSSKDLTVPPTLSNENSPLEITHKLYPSKKIKLQFENESGKPISNVQVLAIGGTVHEANSNGIATIEIPVDDKPSGKLFPYDPSNQYQITSDFGVFLDRLEMADGKPEPITMTRSRSIKGRVRDEQGQTVAGAKVEYTYSRESFPGTQSVLANRSGDFRIDGLPPNTTVTLKAHKDTLATPSDANISVTSGHTEDVSLHVVTQPVAAIAGKITDQQGVPVPGAKVVIKMANVYVPEGYSNESINTGDLITDFAGVISDADGNFQYPATRQFDNRLQVVVNAPGFRKQGFPLVDGSLKNVAEQSIDLGSFPLFKLPLPKKTAVTVVDKDNGKPIAGAKLVFIGIDSRKQVVQTDNQGKVTIEAENTRQLLVVKANGYDLKLNVLESIADTIDVSLTPTGSGNPQVTWLEKDWKLFHEPGRQLLKQLEVPKPKKSTFYRQNMFFGCQINSDFKAFQKAMGLPYKEKQSLLKSNATPIFLNAPQASVKLLMLSGADAYTKVSLLTQSALLTEDEDTKEELYGEAIIQAGESSSGPTRLLTYGQVARSLAFDGRAEVARELIADAWDSSDADELKKQLKSKTAKTRIAEARRFAPAVGLVDANTAIELIRLTSRKNETSRLIAECLIFASLAGDQDIEAICKKQNVELDAEGLRYFFWWNELSHSKYPVTVKWIEDHVETIPDSANKVTAAMLAARHLPDGPRRKKLLQLVAAARKACSPSYHYDDPAKGILEELPKFDSLSMAEFDELLFATLEFAPAKTETMKTNMIYANLIKMVAIKDPEVAEQILDSAFENGAWLYGDPTRSAFSNNILLKAYAWIDPELACQKALELSERYSKEAQVRKLELLTTVISELNTIAIRKGMLRHRK